MFDQLGCFHAFQPIATREDGKVIHVCHECKATRVKRKGRVPTHSKPELAIECFAWLVAIIAAPFLLAAVGSAWTF